jgi:glucose/arabinose dehydrogenase
MRLILIVIASLTLLECATGITRGPAGVHAILDSSGYLYDPNDRSCDGFPRVKVETMPGTCLGLVLPKDQLKDKSTGKALVMPRTILQIKDSEDFLLTDMGGWRVNNGGLYWLRKTGQGFEVIALKLGLNTPHGLSYGPDGFIYLGETQAISRFHFAGGKIIDWQLAVKELPRPKNDMHPLTQFTWDPRNGDMFVNAGAPTDHCYAREDGAYIDCPDSTESGLATIYRYPSAEIKAGAATTREAVAMGLRNSMAMVVSPDGFLIQGENGRDFPELEEPYEEINVINPSHKGLNHGWPQCYDFHAVSPEWIYKEGATSGLRKKYATPLDCSGKLGLNNFYQKPHALIPPHAAPLNMAYYTGGMFPQLSGKLLVSWHGYQPTGHRLVAYPVDKLGRPIIKKPDAGAVFNFDQKGACPVQKPFAPRGGLDQYAPYVEVISGWDEHKGIRPRGSPTGFTVARDGSVFIVEDKNVAVVRLAHTNEPAPPNECAKSDKDTIDPRIEMLAWRNALRSNPGALAGYEQIRSRLIQPYCMQCHGGFTATEIAQDHFQTLDFFVKNDFLIPGNSAKSKLFSAVTKNGDVTPMPPGGERQFLETAEGPAIVQMVRGWIDKLPKDIGDSFAKITVGSARQIRNGTDDKTALNCGTIPPGDIVYVDPRAAQRASIDGWTWTKIYLLPRDSRLNAGKCPVPDDGVYFMKLKHN